jgi:manganese transport protein
VLEAARESLAGRRRGMAGFLPFAGPAFIASIAYMDPGNFATNIQAGARYNYDLLWVVLMANLAAMLFQALSAKLGIVTGRNLAEHAASWFPLPIVRAMWIVSEIAAMATDLAEFLGGAIGLALLAHIPLPLGMFFTALATYALLLLERRGFRPLELTISGLVGIIGICYVAELAVRPPDWAAVVFHTVVPHIDGAGAVALAVGIVGATVMPHAIYLHSALTQSRVPLHDDRERRTALNYSNREVVVALSLAGLINMAMVAMAAAAFHAGHSDVAEIQTAYHTLGPLLGGGAAAVFMVSLIASGLSSSVVGTMAGQVIMQGFVGWRIPIWLRRLITMVPAIVVVSLGVDATQALVVSQIVLSLVLPVPIIALLIFTSDARVMGTFRNSRVTVAGGIVAAAIILALNAILLLQTAGAPVL